MIIHGLCWNCNTPLPISLKTEGFRCICPCCTSFMIAKPSGFVKPYYSDRIEFKPKLFSISVSSSSGMVKEQVSAISKMAAALVVFNKIYPSDPSLRFSDDYQNLLFKDKIIV